MIKLSLRSVHRLGHASALLLLFFVIALPNPSLAQTVSVMQNDSFMPDPATPDLPLHWRPFEHDGRYVLEVDTDQPGTQDGASLRITGLDGHGPTSRAGVQQVSSVQDGTYATYELQVRYKGDVSQADILIWVRNAQTFLELAREFWLLPTPQDEWTEVSFTFTVDASILQSSFVLEAIVYGRGSGTVWYDYVRLIPQEGAAEYMEAAQSDIQTLSSTSKLDAPFAPSDGLRSLQNPPSFTWPADRLATSYELWIARSPDFPSDQTLIYADLDLNLHTPSEPLQAGEWHWMVRGLRGGQVTSQSTVRSFTVAQDASVFVLPPTNQLLANIPDHPRVLVDEAVLAEFHSTVNMDLYTRAMRSQTAHLMGAPLHPEPTFLGDSGGQDYVDFIVPLVNRPSMDLTSRMRNMAHIYVVTGDARFAQEARRIALHLAEWDPHGATGYVNADQAFRDIAVYLSVAYDWIYPELSASDRDSILSAIRARAQILYDDFAVRRKLHEMPYDSHAQTAIGYLGVIAIATLGDIDEAATWFDYVLRTYAAHFPPWGGQDGGWSQGVTYQKWSFSSGAWYWLSLKSAFGIDLFQKPWYQNAGYFKIYFHPPHDKRASFGSGYHAPPEPTDAWNAALLASQTGNGHFKWYAEQVGYVRNPSDPFAFWWQEAYDKAEALPPDGLPTATHFEDIGWVAMHSDLTDPDAVFLIFKSSWYGSFNHSHADQNSFVLQAFGEPLAIRSGVYDYYGSPHDTQWNRQTQAQNAVLFGGKGQSIFDINAEGKIMAFFSGHSFDYTVGDATAAYGNDVEQAHRHIMFVRPNYFVIFDDGRTASPTTSQWMLHATDAMDIDQANQRVTITRPAARLDVDFVAPDALTFSQTDTFPVEPITEYVKEWHLTAERTSESTEHRYLTVLTPSRAGDPYPYAQVQDRSVDGAIAVELVHAEGDRDVIGFRPSTAGEGSVTVEFGRGLAADAAGFAARTTLGEMTHLLLIDGTQLHYGGRGVETQRRATIEVSQDTQTIQLTVVSDQPNSIRLSGYAIEDIRGDQEATPVWSAEGADVIIDVPTGRTELTLTLR